METTEQMRTFNPRTCLFNAYALEFAAVAAPLGHRRSLPEGKVVVFDRTHNVEGDYGPMRCCKFSDGSTGYVAAKWFRKPYVTWLDGIDRDGVG